MRALQGTRAGAGSSVVPGCIGIIGKAAAWLVTRAPPLTLHGTMAAAGSAAGSAAAAPSSSDFDLYIGLARLLCSLPAITWALSRPAEVSLPI